MGFGRMFTLAQYASRMFRVPSSTIIVVRLFRSRLSFRLFVGRFCPLPLTTNPCESACRCLFLFLVVLQFRCCLFRCWCR